MTGNEFHKKNTRGIFDFFFFVSRQIMDGKLASVFEKYFSPSPLVSHIRNFVVSIFFFFLEKIFIMFPIYIYIYYIIHVLKYNVTRKLYCKHI